MKFAKPLTLLDRYLGTQLVLIIVFAIALFTLIWLAPDTLFKLTQYVFSGQISWQQASLMFLYHLPEVLQNTIPVAVLLGTIVLFQRLSQNYELVAFFASGISAARILRSVLWIGLFFGLLHAGSGDPNPVTHCGAVLFLFWGPGVSLAEYPSRSYCRNRSQFQLDSAGAFYRGRPFNGRTHEYY